MAKPSIIAGNWKMHKTDAEAQALALALRKSIPSGSAQVVLCPPFIALAGVAQAISGSALHLGAQNLYPAKEGAFTGEISGAMLIALGCTYVIIGHSERRHILGEDDAFINRKLKAAGEVGLIPIFCVGETLDQRQAGKAFDAVWTQLEQGLADIPGEAIQKMVIAYEPVWAIGTGQVATLQQAVEVHRFIRDRLSAHRIDGQAPSILYGGSVNPANAADLLRETEIDGLLVGGASLEAQAFSHIVAAAQVKTR